METLFDLVVASDVRTRLTVGVYITDLARL